MSFGGPFRSARDLPVENGQLEVRWVSEGSVAAQAGVRVGDQLVSVNGHACEDLDPEDLLRNIYERSMRVAVFERDGENYQVEFR